MGGVKFFAGSSINEKRCGYYFRGGKWSEKNFLSAEGIWRRMRIDSVAQTATFTSLAFFLSSGLSTVAAAPSYGLDVVPQSEFLNAMEPWQHPCGTRVVTPFKRSTQRHSVHRTLKLVRTQLKVAQNHFRGQLPDVHHIYSKVYKVLKAQYHMNWLPAGQFAWYHDELWCMEKGKKAEYALPMLHDALQRFAITFYSLRRFRLKSNINVDDTIDLRNKIFAGMQNEVLKALCEVETAILNLGLQLPGVHKTVVVTGNANWATEGDLTSMLIQDWGVVRLYRAFLNDWMRAFRNATATGPGTCDPTANKPLNFGPKSKSPKKTSGPRAKRPPKIRKPNRQIQKPITLSPEGAILRARRRGFRRRLIKNRRRKIR